MICARVFHNFPIWIVYHAGFGTIAETRDVSASSGTTHPNCGVQMGEVGANIHHGHPINTSASTRILQRWAHYSRCHSWLSPASAL